DVVVAHRVVAGQDQARFHRAVRVGQPVGRGAVRDLPERGLAQDVAAPDHARVDAAALHPLLELAAAHAGPGEDLDREEMPRGVELRRGAREHEYLRVAREVLVEPREVPLAALEETGELAQLHAPERSRDLGRLEVPSDLVEDEQVVVLDPVELGEEVPLALARAEELRLPPAPPPPPPRATGAGPPPPPTDPSPPAAPGAQ